VVEPTFETTGHDRRPVEDEAPSLPRILSVVAVVAGVMARLVILFGPLGRPDADEVITGLMARHVLDGGGFPLFFWGQNYGGTLQLVPVTLSTWAFGSSVAALRLPTIVLAAVNAVLVWRLARLFLPRPSAQAAGLLLWLGPPAALWFGVREMLFYQPTVTLGLVLGILGVRWRERRRALDAALATAILAVGVWTSPNMVYFAVPALVTAAAPWIRGRRAVVAAVVGIAAAAAVSVVIDRRLVSGASHTPVIGTYASRLVWFGEIGLPASLGIVELLTLRWVVVPLSVCAYGIALWLLARAWWPGAKDLAWDAVGLAAFPLLFAIVPFGPDEPNLRYLFFVSPFLVVVFARLVTRPRLAALALTVMFAVTVVGLIRLAVVSEQGPVAGPTRVGNVGDLSAAIAVLDADQVDAVFADYWVAYRLAFETQGRIVTSSSWGIERDLPSTEAVRRAGRSAWVVSAGPQADAFRAGLARRGIEARAEEAGDLVVIVPVRPVLPEDVPIAARHA
jgi:hypothetical protein